MTSPPSWTSSKIERADDRRSRLGSCTGVARRHLSTRAGRAFGCRVRRSPPSVLGRRAQPEATLVVHAVVPVPGCRRSGTHRGRLGTFLHVGPQRRGSRQRRLHGTSDRRPVASWDDSAPGSIGTARMSIPRPSPVTDAAWTCRRSRVRRWACGAAGTWH